MIIFFNFTLSLHLENMYEYLIYLKSQKKEPKEILS